MKGLQITVEWLDDDGLVVGEPKREFIPFRFEEMKKYATPYETCKKCSHNDNGCTSKNDCDGYEEWIETGKTINVTA